MIIDSKDLLDALKVVKPLVKPKEPALRRIRDWLHFRHDGESLTITLGYENRFHRASPIKIVKEKGDTLEGEFVIDKIWFHSLESFAEALSKNMYQSYNDSTSRIDLWFEHKNACFSMQSARSLGLVVPIVNKEHINETEMKYVDETFNLVHKNRLNIMADNLKEAKDLIGKTTNMWSAGIRLGKNASTEVWKTRNKNDVVRKPITAETSQVTEHVKESIAAVKWLHVSDFHKISKSFLSFSWDEESDNEAVLVRDKKGNKMISAFCNPA